MSGIAEVMTNEGLGRYRHMENYGMKHSAKIAFILFALGTVLCPARGAHAQRPRPTDAPAIITSTRVAVPDGVFFGPLYATIGARERKIADEAVAAWIIQGGRGVVYSGRDGAGGHFRDLIDPVILGHDLTPPARSRVINA